MATPNIVPINKVDTSGFTTAQLNAFNTAKALISPSQLNSQEAALVPGAPSVPNTLPVATPPPVTVATQATPTETQSTGLTDLFKQYLGQQTAPASLSDEYAKQAQAAGLEQKQQSVQRYTDQLTQLSAQNTAANLQIDNRQIPSYAIDSEKSRQNREYAIQALPIQANLAMAQGDLQSAQTHVDTMFKMYSQDAQAQYDYKNRIVEAVYNFASKEQQALLDAAKTQSDQNFTLKRDAISNANELAKTALANGQSGLYSKIVGLDANSPTYTQDVARLGGQIQPKVTAVKRDTQIVNGKLIDMQTGAVISDLSSPTSNALGNALSGAKVDNINNILSSKSLDSAVGPSGLARTDTGLWSATKRFFSGLLGGAVAGGAGGAVFAGIGAIPGAIIGGLTTGVVNSLRGTKDELTGDRQNFIASVEQMRSELTVEKLAQAKGQGVTFGALSDGERGLIANAATKLGSWAIHEGGKADGTVTGYNIDEKSFKAEMDKINYFTKLDALIKGATPESVGAVTNPDGTIWILNSDGTLTQMIRQ